MINILTENSATPFGIYRLDKEYISFMKKSDDNVLDPDATDRYCGPLFSITNDYGTVNYFAPILPEYDEYKNLDNIFEPTFNDGIICSFIDARKSLPCLEKYISKDNSDEKLSQNCINMQIFIAGCAKQVYETVRAKTSENEEIKEDKYIDPYIKPTIQAGVYRINKNHIAALRQSNDNILDPEYTNRYYGPVFCLNTENSPVNYFIPIEPSYETMEYTFLGCSGYLISGYMDARGLIPCSDEHLELDESNTNLINECVQYKNAIEHFSKILYKKIYDPRKKTTTPPDIYNIDENYLTSLKQQNDNVLDPECTNRYYGPVFSLETTAGLIDYFIPVDPIFDAFDRRKPVPMCFHDNMISEFLNTQNIIPCPRKYIKCNDTDKRLRSACWRQQWLIEGCSEFAYQKSLQPDRSTDND